MAKDPAFLFYTQDFAIGTQFFTDEQVGKYIRLLIAQHQHGHLSENQVLSICKSYDNDVLSKFSKDSDGKWYNERLDIEIVKRKKYADSRGRNGKGKKIISKAYDLHSENENCIHVLDNTNTDEKNQFPTPETCTTILPESEKVKAIEIYHRSKYILLTPLQVENFWELFKLKKMDGKTLFENDYETIKHFKNWIVFQKLESSAVRHTYFGTGRDANGMVN